MNNELQILFGSKEIDQSFLECDGIVCWRIHGGVGCPGVFRLLASVTLLAEHGLFVGCQGCLKFAGGIVGRYGW